MNDLTGVPQTLFLPLFRRAQLTKAGNRILTDRLAVELVDRVSYDFSALAASYKPQRDIAWVARPRQMDLLIAEFLREHPGATVVNLGAGLDTTFSRVDDGRVRWFDLDLPEVIAVRRELLAESERSRCIARSLFDWAWTDELGDTSKGVMLVSAGVLFYFPKPEVQHLFAELHRRLPGAQVVFDAVTPLGLKGANRMVKDANMKGAALQWALKDPSEMERWGVGVTGVEQVPLFRGLPREGLSLKTRLFMRFMDLTRASSIIRCRV